MKFAFSSDADLEALIEKIVSASNRGVSATRNASGEPNWSFGQSLFFSSTVVTTIGKNSIRGEPYYFYFVISIEKNNTYLYPNVSNPVLT